MAPSTFHLIAPAGSCRKFLAEMNLTTPAELIAVVQEAVGAGYRVTGDEAIIGADEDEERGGRNDDRERATDIERALADSDVVAMVALRGGSWFTRILPRIDFSVLDRRTRPIAVFAFSELTTLVNIVGAHRSGLGIYDMAPAFLTYGLRHQIRMAARSRGLAPARPDATRLRSEFRAFFRDVVSMIEGRGTKRPITARIIRGRLLDRCDAVFVGGNLCVLTTLLASPFRDAVAPSGRWLVLEEFNERPYRIDRFLAQLTLAGFWTHCAGILLGDFHRGLIDQGETVEALLTHHLPPDREIPVLATRQVGHIVPMSPLPLHLDVTIARGDEGCYSIGWPVSALGVV